MIFKLTTTGNFYTTKEKEKLERLGFRFDAAKSTSDCHFKDPRCSAEIEISTIEELVKFCDEWGDLIMTCSNKDHVIEIYDNWRES